MHLGVSALAKKPRDADAEAGGQGEISRVEGQRSEGQRGPESKSEGPRPVRSGPELEDNWMRKSYSIFNSFKSTYE